jgi:hypothetical protein
MDLDPEVQAALADSEPAPDDLLDFVPKDKEPPAGPENQPPRTS